MQSQRFTAEPRRKAPCLSRRTEVQEFFLSKHDFAVADVTSYRKNSQNNVKVLTLPGGTGNPAVVNKTVRCLKSEFSDAASVSLGFIEKKNTERRKIIRENNSGGFQEPDISPAPAAVWGRRSGRLQTTSQPARNHISFDGVGWFTLNLAHAWPSPGSAHFTFHYRGWSSNRCAGASPATLAPTASGGSRRGKERNLEQRRLICCV